MRSFDLPKTAPSWQTDNFQVPTTPDEEVPRFPFRTSWSRHLSCRTITRTQWEQRQIPYRGDADPRQPESEAGRQRCVPEPRAARIA